MPRPTTTARAAAARLVGRTGVADELRAIYARRSPRARAARRRWLQEQADDRALQAILAVLVRPGSNCVDIGAHRGDVLEVFARLAPQGRHVAVEPIPHLAAGLRERFPAVEVLELALADEPGEAAFTHVVDDPGYSGLRDRPHPDGPTRRLTVRVETLDAALPDGYVPDLIKIDVEGAEGRLLAGARRTLDQRPVVVFEHGPTAASLFGTTARDVWEALAGFRLFTLTGVPLESVGRFEAATRQELGPCWNYVAVPG